MSVYIFHFAVFSIFYVYFGYLIVLSILSVFSSRKVNKREIFPLVSILIPAHNEEAYIIKTIKNKLNLHYPQDKMEIVVVADGCTDNTLSLLHDVDDPRLKVIEVKKRKGKSNALNRGVKEAKGEIIVFSDANSIYQQNALELLVRSFADDRVGYVTGRMVTIKQDGCLISEGMSSYTLYEHILRELESAINSIVGCDGGIDAIRRELICHIPRQMIPDFYLPLKVIEQGKRVVYDSTAISKEEVLKETSNEFKMRVRVIVRSFNAIFHMKHLLNPVEYPFFSFQFLSHKIFRYLVPFLQILLFGINIKMLGYGYWYSIFFVGQVVFYLSAIYGCLIMFRGLKLSRVFYIPYYFCLVNLASLIAAYKYLRGERFSIWEPRKG